MSANFSKEQCLEKHTAFQPGDEDWRCPKCKASSEEGFWIDNDFEATEDRCDHALHDTDAISCNKCGHYTTGKQFAASVAKKKGMVPCSCCKGTGFVAGEAK